MSNSPIVRVAFDATELACDFPPRFHDKNKKPHASREDLVHPLEE